MIHIALEVDLFGTPDALRLVRTFQTSGGGPSLLGLLCLVEEV